MMERSLKPAKLPPGTIILAGPTGSGKSEAAVELAAAWGGEIVNADAFQLYRGWPVLSAAPDAESMRRVPHYLYACVDLSEEMNAGVYREAALPMVWNIARRGAVPVIVGGSGLYLKTLTHGLSDAPGDESLRREFRTLDTATLWAWLESADPEAAKRVDAANRRYVERALEIVLTTGKQVRVVKREWARDPEDVRGVCLTRERADLYARIDRRVEQMLQRGLVEEVRGLGELSRTAEKAIGVREIREYLKGLCSLEEAIARMQQASRRYAKRQTAWFQRERWMQTVCAGAGEDAKAVALRAAQAIGLRERNER